MLSEFVEHYDDVESYVAGRSRSKDEASDIVQDAYLRVLRLPHPEKILAPRHFLFRLARNLIIDRLRTRQVRERFLQDAEDIERIPDLRASPDRAADVGERRALLERAVAQLPPRTREMFILHAYARMSYAEVAKHMALSKSAVAKHLSRAIATLHTALQEAGLRGC